MNRAFGAVQIVAGSWGDAPRWDWVGPLALKKTTATLAVSDGFWPSSRKK
jgi:hypothetical protein